MDWKGQKVAEQIMLYAFMAAAVTSLAAGYLTASFKLMLMIYFGSVLVILVVIVPDWPFFNRHPLEWTHVKSASDAMPQVPNLKSQSASKRQKK